MSSYEARIDNPCMQCETVTVSNQKFTTHENNWRITRTQPVLQHPSSLFFFVCRYLNIALTPPINLGPFSDLSRSSSASAVVLRCVFIGFRVRQMHLTVPQWYLHCVCLECWSLLANRHRQRHGSVGVQNGFSPSSVAKKITTATRTYLEL